ncbi:uncharacterized protein LOC127713966 [Mytilus californianus]|uniref:uncharacterized protein LOC127713966 n=1 Tax=Mytilus californianus TaxID=6549 RepID=UPI002245731A|nr:uncharacterized protein LOC127713966 [Mytilus californianus]
MHASYSKKHTTKFHWEEDNRQGIEEVDRPIVAEEDIQPYQFEPELSDGNSDDGRDFASLDGDDDMEHRLGNTNWCDCGNCESMPKAEECICCHELSRVTEKMEELPTPVSCITEHPGFEPVCLNQYVLETAYFQY